MQRPRRRQGQFALLTVGVALALSASLATGCGLSRGCDSPNVDCSTVIKLPRLIEIKMLSAAQRGRFQPPPQGHRYANPVECRIDPGYRFHHEHVYLCKISISNDPTAHLWEWGSIYRGNLHSHTSDPTKIPTITGAWDPPW